MTPQVHPSSFISDNVSLSNNVKIGPHCYLNGNINIGENTELKSHVVISGNTNIGKNNIFYPFSNIGCDPQDLKFNGEESSLFIGDDNIFREYVEKLNYPIVKLKYLNRTYYNQDHLPEDFDAFEYRRLHSDLSSLDEVSIKRHFLKNGMREGRKYKKGQKSKCPIFLKNILSKEFPQITSQLTFEDKNV